MKIYTAYTDNLKDINADEYQVISFCQNVPEDSETVNFSCLVPGKEMSKFYEKTKDADKFLRGYFEFMLKPLLFKNDCVFARMLAIAEGKKIMFVRSRTSNLPDFFAYIQKAFAKKYGIEFVQVKFTKQAGLF